MVDSGELVTIGQSQGAHKVLPQLEINTVQYTPDELQFIVSTMSQHQVWDWY